MRVVTTVLLLMFAALFVACGSDGDEPTPTPTELADPNSLSDPQDALDAAQSLWGVRGGDDYDMTFNWQCFCVLEYVARVDLEVRAGSIHAGVVTDDRTALSAERLAEYQTVERLFELVQDAIDQDAEEIRVTYAPEGHPSEVWIDYSTRVADEELGFFIHQLTVR